MSSSESKPNLTVAVLGHVDSGKSTVVGHLRYICGCVTEREMTKMTEQSAEAGKPSFKFAWLNDRTRDERERGITVNSSQRQLFTPTFTLNLVDTPGHRHFTKNAIAGASSADCALLVIDATIGAFECSMSKNGQANEMALIAFALGMKQLIVVVNKMDALSTAYDAERFLEIKREVAECLAKLGFKDENVQYVPVSGWEGQNLVSSSTRMPWYNGMTLLEAFANFTEPRRASDKPLRMTVQEVFKIAGIGTVVTGYVHTGVLRPGMQLSFGRIGGATATVFSIESHHRQLSEAPAGLSVGVNLKGIDKDAIKRGWVASDVSHDAARTVVEFTAQLVILQQVGSTKIRPGYSPVVHCHSTHVACRIEEIISTLDRQTGAVLDKDPTEVGAGDACVVRLVPSAFAVVEAFREYPALGRVVVRDAGVTIAVGIIRLVKKADVTP